MTMPAAATRRLSAAAAIVAAILWLTPVAMAEPAALDRQLDLPDLDGPPGEMRLSGAIEMAFPAGDGAAGLPWLAILRHDGADRPMTKDERQSFARQYLPAANMLIGGRTVTAVRSLDDTAFLSLAPTAHFRLAFDYGPDLWLHTFASSERAGSWASGVMLSQVLAGNDRPITGTVVDAGGQRFVCLDDGDAPGRVVVCGTRLLEGRAILSAARRADCSGKPDRDTARAELVRLVDAAATGIRSLNAGAQPEWAPPKAQLR
jgi:hypothetical protein